jgi:hypothetical protein
VILGIFGDAMVMLTAVPAGPVDAALYLGTLTSFTTTNPAEACLAQGPPLKVYGTGSASRYDVAVASARSDCTAQEFTFPS